MFFVMLVAAGFGRAWYGIDGVWAAVAASVVCGVSFTAALLAAVWFRRPRQALHGLLLGMLFRMGLPLVAIVGFQSGRGPLASAGVVGMIAAVYLAALPIETLLSLRIVNSSRGG